MDDDYRSQSGGFGTLLVILLVVVLIIALGGGGVMYVATLRYQAAAQRAEAEAALQAHRAAEDSREELALRAAQARDAAAKDAAPAATPAGPLEPANNAFRAAYKSARQDTLIAVGPVVIVSGDDLVLHRAGKRTSAKVVPPLYHDLKVYSHVPLAAYLLTRPGLDADRRAELTMFLNDVEAIGDVVKLGPFNDDQRRRQQTIIEETLRYLKDAEKTVKPEDRTAFARKMAPLVLANSTDAAKTQIDGLHQQMTKWRAELPPEEWKALKVVVTGGPMPRVGNLAVQYFAWLLGEPGEGKRIVYAEAIFDETKALNLLATHRLDADVGTAFFNDDRRMHRDLLSDAATEILKGMKP
jgi:Tfp pilus assembly protein PilX